MSPQKPGKKRKPQPRLPLEAALKLRSHPVSTKKGVRGYDRKLVKEKNRTIIKQELIEENN